MLSPRALCTSLILSLCLLAHASGQVKEQRVNPTSTLTAVATAERVRFTAPNSVVQMHLQVFAGSGEVLADLTSKGNVLDWMIQDGGGNRLIAGSYLCVLTVKNVSGRLIQKISSVAVQDKHAELLQTDTTKITSAQQQAVGPIEESDELVILKPGEVEASTVVAHNGESGQVVRTRGALTFKIGDFFSGTDREQMRLTPEGNLGIGTTRPRARVDVEGLIRTTQGILFADGTVQTTGISGRKDKRGNIVPNATGIGTTNQIAKWADNAGTLGDSTITEVGGRVGIGVPNPTYNLVVGPDIGPGLLRSILTVSRGPGLSVGAYVGASGARGMEFGWDEAAGRAFVNAPDGTPITFTQGGVSERLRITALGNIGIGTITPSAKLDVLGPINSVQYNIGGNRVLSAPGTNTFIGVTAGDANTTGSANVFVGNAAGRANTGGQTNVFVGAAAGIGNETGFENVFVGAGAGQSNKVGQLNSFVGTGAGSNNNGSSNTFVGNTAGSQNKTGNGNSIFGGFAGTFNPDGSFNSIFGFSAGQRNTGEENSFFGANAAKNLNEGSHNVAIGFNAGTSLVDGSDNIYIANVGANESNRIRIGSQGTHTETFVAGISGVFVAGDPVFVSATGQLGIGVSSLRFKQHIRAIGTRSANLMKLRPVAFHYRPEYAAGNETLQYGLIAEEVAKIYPELVGYSSDGQPQTVRYHLLNTMLLSEIQKQQREIESQRMQLNSKTRQLNALEKRLQRLELLITSQRKNRR